MFVHHVYFWLKNPDNQEEYNSLKNGIESLLEIEPKVFAHVGIPAPTNRPVIDTSYHFSFLQVFDSAEDQESYQVHPIHMKFIENCSSLWSRVVVYDSI